MKTFLQKWIMQPLIVTLSCGLIIYVIESQKETSDYFTYYGNVPTDVIFHFPEKISAYTFGEVYEDNLDIQFLNTLWCQPIGGSPKGFKAIAARKKLNENFTFGNVAPTNMIKNITLAGENTQISLLDGNYIRAYSDQYGAWDMGWVRPYADSTCYIETVATTYTPIFRLPKSVRYVANSFTYSTKLRKVGKYDAPYDVWRRKQGKSGVEELITIDD